MDNFLGQEFYLRQLIQPPKFSYKLMNLGPPVFELQQNVYERFDFLTSTRDHLSLQCSLFYQKGTTPNQIIIYLHCNNGNRLEGIQYAYQALKLGFGFVCFDSRACGNSQGKYITLGFRQSKDLHLVIQKVQEYVCNEKKGYKLEYILWGRSMGAVTAIKYLQNPNNREKVISIVLDSPFLNLREVIHEAAKKIIGVPNILTDIAIKYLDCKLKDKINLKIDDFQLEDTLKQIDCPLILMASRNDGLIPQHHFLKIYESHTAKKTIFYLDQAHSDNRNDNTIQAVFKSLSKHVAVEALKRKQNQECLQTYRSQIQSKPKSVSSKKLSVTSKEIMLSRSNSIVFRQNCQETKPKPQIQGYKRLINLNADLWNRKRKSVNNFETNTKRTIKILNLRGLKNKQNR